MRTVIPVALLVLSAAFDARAGDAEFQTTPELPHLLEPVQSIVFRYDAESLMATLELGLGHGRITFGIANAFELPEHEPSGGIYLDQWTLLTEELSGFEIDSGGERMFSLRFGIDW